MSGVKVQMKGQREVGVATKGQQRNPYENRNVLHLDFINVDILAWIFYCSFVRYFLPEKLSKVYIQYLCIIFTNECKSLIISKLKIKNNLKIKFMFKSIAFLCVSLSMVMFLVTSLFQHHQTFIYTIFLSIVYIFTFYFAIWYQKRL